MTIQTDLGSDAYNAAFEAFEQAVAKAPGQTAFANICRCTQGNVSQLLRAKSLLPGRHVLRVEAATGISRHRLRPDIYPLDNQITPDTSDVACEGNPILQRPDTANDA